MMSDIGLSLLFILANFCMVIAFIVVWARNFEETRQFKRVGLTFVAIILLTGAIAVTLPGVEKLSESLAYLFALEALVAVRIYAITVVGLLLAQWLHQQNENWSGGFGAAIPSGRTLAITGLALLVMIAFSVILFRQSGAQIGAVLEAQGVQDMHVSAGAVLAVAVMGFSEEISFRLGLQNALTYLLRSTQAGPQLAIVLSSAFWSLGHIGVVEPGWVKFVQIFVFGLILGQLNRRFGVIPCIVLHVSFNVIMAMVAPVVFEGMVPSA